MLVGFVDIKEMLPVKGTTKMIESKTVAPVLFVKDPLTEPKTAFSNLYHNFVKGNILSVIGDNAGTIEARVSDDRQIMSYADFIAKPGDVDNRLYKPEKAGYKRIVLRGFHIDKRWEILIDRRWGRFEDDKVHTH
jgi:hypothetical protein